MFKPHDVVRAYSSTDIYLIISDNSGWGYTCQVLASGKQHRVGQTLLLTPDFKGLLLGRRYKRTI